ncbi:hypothetical protein [Phocicoccus schoeneichii]|uniref:Uncharacterized protein n=2 Tax=Phocicoccus schoeneichii TaxID=1812261 RepID=A0A6V7RJ78_9BACL|nr:hypothetical protein [Jeotgalicoccus schoeneichii]CAD2077458.1 hypothetical protein JEOSCH030_01306 [Jeotgalicoccus schoeneichii]
MIDGEPETIENIYDSNKKEVVGKIIRYEIEYNYNPDNIVNEISYLVFTEDNLTNKINSYIVDNSSLYKEGIIKIINTTSNYIEEFDVSQEDFYIDYKNDIDAEISLQLKKSKSSSEAEYLCFNCTQYISNTVDYSSSCHTAFGYICGAVAIYSQMPGFLLCAGVATLSCWVPPRKVCVKGNWHTSCLIQSELPAM